MYRPRRQSHKDAHLILRSRPCGPDCTCPTDTDGTRLGAAELLNVVLTRQTTNGRELSATRTVLLIVRRRHCLKPTDLPSDPYRQFAFSVSGCLFSKQFQASEVANSRDIICPLALTPYREPPSQKYGTRVHVLPLSRVSGCVISQIRILTNIAF